MRMTPAELVLIRGLPGSGKSTLARTEYVPRGFSHVEADNYFVDGIGRYVFEPAKLSAAHKWVQDATRAYLVSGRSVVVSNTFTRAWEMEPYRAMAREVGAPLTIRTTTGSWPNIHGVPGEVIERMRARWEP